MIFDWDYLCPTHGGEQDGALVGAFEIMGRRDAGRYVVEAIECMQERCRFVAVRLKPTRARPHPGPWILSGEDAAAWWAAPWPERALSVLDL